MILHFLIQAESVNLCSYEVKRLQCFIVSFRTLVNFIDFLIFFEKVVLVIGLKPIFLFFFSKKEEENADPICFELF